MAETAEQLREKIQALIQPGFRARLNARGTARAMVWRQGSVPTDGPNFGNALTTELLSYGFGLLRSALSARKAGVDEQQVHRAFEMAAEALDSVVRNGDPDDEARGFYRVIAAASYHMGRFSARAYSLLAHVVNDENRSIAEQALAMLIMRDLDRLQLFVLGNLSNIDSNDVAVAKRLDDSVDTFDLDDALTEAVSANYLRALSAFLFALRADDHDSFALVQERLRDGEEICFQTGIISIWWIYRLTGILLGDLWNASIQNLLPKNPNDESRWPELRELFIALLASRSTAELDLWPSQIDAASRVMNVDDDIVASLPTSAGKTRIAELCILRTLSLGRRVVFVTPLRSLSAQTERTLRSTFSPLGFDVSSLYGSAGASAADLDSLENRHIVVSTPEKLDFALRNNPDLLNDVGLIVLDEGHMLGASEREVRYEVLIQRLLKRVDSASRRIVCLSAMLPSGNQLEDFVNWLRQDAPGGPILNAWRPTRQRFGQIVWKSDRARYELAIEEETTFINDFVHQKTKIGPRGGKKKFPDDQNSLVIAAAWRLVQERLSVLIYCPEKRSAIAVAKRIIEANRSGFLESLANVNLDAIGKAVAVGKEWLGSEHPAVRCLSFGVALHHGSLPRPFLREIDQLIKERKIQVIVASPTLSRGLNVSASCVLFQSCERFVSAQNQRLPIPVEEMANVSGRAGRAYVDLDGQALGVFFDSSQLYKWTKLVAAQSERHLESGLFLTMIPLFNELVQRAGNADAVVEYVLNNSNAWAASVDDKEPIAGWTQALAILDIALLSLLGDTECSADDAAIVLDDILSSSFLKRRLQKKKERTQQVVSAILASRAKYICSNSTPQQRRGYFFSGVGLGAGQFLDSHSAKLNELLLGAEIELVFGDYDNCILEILKIAELVFQVDPFRPNKLPNTWKDITAGWLSGKPMNELQELDDDASSFIEDGIVYRLVWAIEAIRVRARANQELPMNDKPTPLISVIETGTLFIPQAILLQAGLSSRVAAAKALEQFPAQFENISGMREWLFSSVVQEATQLAGWPTVGSQPAWEEFVASQRVIAGGKWVVREHDIALTSIKNVDFINSGQAVFAWQTPGTSTIRVFSPDMGEVAHTGSQFRARTIPWATARIVDDNTVRIRYIGPEPQ